METPLSPTGPKQVVVPEAAKTKTILVLMLVGLLILLGGGLFFAFAGSSSPVGAGWFLFSFAMGVTMIVLPCTLPLAFVIVPLAMGKSPRKGFAMALAFGAGVAVTLSLYGVLAAIVGKVAIGSLNAPLETVKNWLYAFAGIFAYLFALGELGFMRFRMPTYSGAAPMFIQKKKDALKALLLGLFMGNIGVGCPHPATPLILTRIAASGDVFYGWLLFFVHALGRITPLLTLAILGILGVNALTWITKRRERIERATGWAMVFVAGFIFTLGLFTHDWWTNSGQHTLLEDITQEERLLGIIGGRLGTGNPHTHGAAEGHGLFGLPLWLGNWTLVFLWVVPMFWYTLRRQNRMLALPPEEQKKEAAVLPWLKAFVVTLTLLLGFIFIVALPHRFLQHEAVEEEGAHGGEMMQRRGGHDVRVEFSSASETVLSGTPTTLSFLFEGARLDEFEIDHDRLVHLIIVREDLTVFSHVHLEPVAESPARFEVTYTFPLSGIYLLSLNYVHNGAEGTWMDSISVAGNDPVSVDADTGRTKRVGPYEVRLTTDPEVPRAGEETHLEWTIAKNGVPVRDLTPYLAAPAHIAIVRDDLRYFLHEHGDLPERAAFLPFVAVAHAHGEQEPPAAISHGEHAELPSAFGPTVEGHVTFPAAGRYKVFAEFLHEGEVLTAGFLIDVSEGG